MATFNSVNALEKYIKNAVSKSMKDAGDETENIMREEIQTQVYDGYKDNPYRTGQLMDSIGITKITDDSVEVSWQDNGDWNSLINGNHMYVIHGLEMGKTWGEGGYRPQTNLVETSNERVKTEIPDTIKKSLKGQGVPVK